MDAMAIKQWPLAERPRERLLSLGPKYLTDAELVAILLHTGSVGLSAVLVPISIVDISQANSVCKTPRAVASSFVLYAKFNLGP